VHIRLEFQYTWDELREAQKAHANKRTRGGAGGRRSGGLLGWLMFILLAILLFIIQFNKRGRSAVQPSNPAPAPQSWADWYEYYKVVLWAGLFVAAFVFFFVRALRDARKRFEREPAAHRLQTVEITEGGLSQSTHASSTQYKWEAFIRQLETPNLFVLYVTEVTFLLLPKRAFAGQDEINAFRELVAGVVNPPGRAFPVLPPKA
jgi:magnesium-transporting ATPase (P-type)